MKLIILSLFAFFAFSLNVNAQSTNKGKTTQEKLDLCKQVENTYQIIANDKRTHLAITTDICEIVIRERQKDKTIIYKVNELYSVKIYSEKGIPLIKQPLQYIIYNEN